jgi:hypothetical protein
MIDAFKFCENERSRYEICKYSLEFYCRNYNGSIESLISVRSDFEKCIKQGFKSHDLLCKIYMIWAEFETYKVKDMVKMEEIMEMLLKITNYDNTYLNAYIQYVKFFGRTEVIRSVFKRSLEHSTSDRLVFSIQWIAWEKMYTEYTLVLEHPRI